MTHMLMYKIIKERRHMYIVNYFKLDVKNIMFNTKTIILLIMITKTVIQRIMMMVVKYL